VCSAGCAGQGGGGLLGHAFDQPKRIGSQEYKKGPCSLISTTAIGGGDRRGGGREGEGRGNTDERLLNHQTARFQIILEFRSPPLCQKSKVS
jgi:hypothetical protein